MTTKFHGKTFTAFSASEGWYIAGLFNTDGGFSLHVEKNNSSVFKYRVLPVITLTQHENSKNVLELVKRFFNDGKIVKQNQNCFQYRIKSRQIIIEKIIPFFSKYKLIGFKYTQFMVFRHLIFLMQDKFHLSSSGFYSFVSIILFINRFPKRKIRLENILISHEKKYGNCKVVYSKTLNKLLLLHFLKKDYNTKMKSLNPCFVLGLIEGDGGFSLSFKKKIKPSFYFSQESTNIVTGKTFSRKRSFLPEGKEWNMEQLRCSEKKEKPLLFGLKVPVSLKPKKQGVFVLLQKFFHGGKIYNITDFYSRFIISDRKTFIHHVFPFFEKYSLHGEKKKAF